MLYGRQNGRPERNQYARDAFGPTLADAWQLTEDGNLPAHCAKRLQEVYVYDPSHVRKLRAATRYDTTSPPLAGVDWPRPAHWPGTGLRRLFCVDP